ncbi:MAG TPA: hypothetical protein VKH19_19045 [Gemmatimonadaceae bacterium]|nr:hypothetical protein [Gemmatimonadaceae bacterium]
MTIASLGTSCRPEGEAYRGGRLDVSHLPAADVAAVYDAAVAGAFDVADPSLSILVDTLLLPRAAGLEGGARMNDAVLAAMRDAGAVKGVCSIPVRATHDPLRCDAARSGYVVRFSDPFARSTDSVQVNMVVEQYAIRAGPAAERLRFERAYQIARKGAAWRAVREGRLPRP